MTLAFFKKHLRLFVRYGAHPDAGNVLAVVESVDRLAALAPRERTLHLARASELDKELWAVFEEISKRDTGAGPTLLVCTDSLCWLCEEGKRWGAL